MNPRTIRDFLLMCAIRFIFFLIFVIYLSGCKDKSPEPLPSSVQEVLATLKSQIQTEKAINYMVDLKLGILEKKIAESKNQHPELLLEYAECLLNNGLTTKAIEELKKMKSSPKARLDSDFVYRMDKQLAIAYMRMGEGQNCIGKPNPAACLFPLKKEAIYVDKIGSMLAIEILEKLLLIDPYDLESKWLLNLAFMTLGNYPDGPPEKWLIPPSRFESKSSIGRFEDKAGSMGLEHIGLAGGVIMDDFNNDGALDIVLSEIYFDRQLKFYINTGDGRFSDQTEAAGLLGEFGGLNMIQADYNNDGWLDFLVLRGAWFASNGQHPNSLLRNNGDGTFTDVTIGAGLYSLYPTQSAIWGDFNRDGWIDLLIANESNSRFKAPIEFFINNKDGTFIDMAKEAGLRDIVGFFKGITMTDFDNNLWPDVFISNLKGKNYLLKNLGVDNNGAVRFSDISNVADIEKPRTSFSCWAWDYNNDGLEDIMALPYSFNHQHVYEELMGLQITGGEGVGFYQNNGDGTFTNIAKEVSLDRPYYAMAGNFGDFDNDGFLDFYLGTGSPSMGILVPNRMVRNVNGSYFEDITFSADVGHLQKGHSIAVGDLDNDGDQDIYAELGGIFIADVFQNLVLINPGQGNNWVNLKLIGTKANKSAIGSKIELTLKTGDQERSLFRTVNSGGSFGSSSLQQEIGLAKADLIKQIKITWAGSGTVEVFYNVAINRAYQITEENTLLEERILKEFVF
ncbi:MAG: tetratricopeptide (TPR) repeat protein [Saprospiraceae bacterium]|jgi:tetratricopeptide (TPR) repeat protein